MSIQGMAVLAAYGVLLAWLFYRGKKSNWSSGATRALVWGATPALLFAVIFVGLQFGGESDADRQAKAAEMVGVDANATRLKLRELSDALVTADKKGDAALAQTIMHHAVDIMVTMERQPPGSKSLPRDCTLAAQHLATGAETIARGGRWRNADQFQAAAGDCRT